MAPQKTASEAEAGNELFRALAHPIPVEILRALEREPRADTDLRRCVQPRRDSWLLQGGIDYHLDSSDRVAIIHYEEDAYERATAGKERDEPPRQPRSAGDGRLSRGRHSRRVRLVRG